MKTKSKILPEIFELRKIKYHHWYLDVFTNWLMVLFIIAIAMSVDRYLFYYLCLFPIGMIQLRMGLLSHDAVHGLIMKNKTGNALVSSLTTYWPMFISLESYKGHHLPHHRYVGTRQDPELIEIKLANRPRWDLPMTKKKLFLILIKDALFMNPQETMKMVVDLSPKTPKGIVGMGLFWCAFLSVVFYFNFWVPLLLWYLALIGPFQVFYRLRGLTEHSGIKSSYRFTPKWWQKITFLPHNTWCHWEHHKYPFVPYYNLPKVRLLDDSEDVITAKEVFELLADGKTDEFDYLSEEELRALQLGPL